MCAGCNVNQDQFYGIGAQYVPAVNAELMAQVNGHPAVLHYTSSGVVVPQMIPGAPKTGMLSLRKLSNGTVVASRVPGY